MQTSFQSSRILLPASNHFIVFSFVIAFFLNFLPIAQFSWMPDWVALVLCFWGIRERRRVSTGWAFIFGLLMDVADGAVMGQHALAYVIMNYLCGFFSRRILWFPLASQSIYVLPFLLLAQLIQLLARSLTGGEFPGFGYFVGPVLAAVLWLPVSLLLLLPQHRPVERDENRPI